MIGGESKKLLDQSRLNERFGSEAIHQFDHRSEAVTT
jgi:hypothetical protein